MNVLFSTLNSGVKSSRVNGLAVEGNSVVGHLYVYNRRRRRCNYHPQSRGLSSGRVDVVESSYQNAYSIRVRGIDEKELP